ncbi:HK97 family phage prohead protease [Cognatiluteimonas weifangensis]|uniref:HK97 family phage prohead protease n=1 Tax=Cognatiluteimonas weifangensis TaxID=2303539 RepID=A0A372DNM0_9GAMM|nr:HK97 family phage prohead protease [Luteimonas weifangensis]RFP61109.1 HK97 family phage prohead protease [Luteimonas weifangensis]
MIEKRATAGVTAKGRTLSGYIAKYDNATQIGGFTEIIRRGAFAASLASGRDILALADHDTSRVLGRTRSGTLELREDAEGLAFTLQLPDTQAGRDLAALAERGDLGGCSFAFTVPKGGDAWNGNTRELRNVDLDEVSIVQSRPAYPDTEVHLRSLQPQSQVALLHKWLETCR